MSDCRLPSALPTQTMVDAYVWLVVISTVVPFCCCIAAGMAKRALRRNYRRRSSLPDEYAESDLEEFSPWVLNSELAARRAAKTKRLPGERLGNTAMEMAEMDAMNEMNRPPTPHTEDEPLESAPTWASPAAAAARS